MMRHYQREELQRYKEGLSEGKLKEKTLTSSLI